MLFLSSLQWNCLPNEEIEILIWTTNIHEWDKLLQPMKDIMYGMTTMDRAYLMWLFIGQGSLSCVMKLSWQIDIEGAIQNKCSGTRWFIYVESSSHGTFLLQNRSQYQYKHFTSVKCTGPTHTTIPKCTRAFCLRQWFDKLMFLFRTLFSFG